MTLEKTIPQLAFTEDSFIPNSPSEKKKYHTLQFSPKPQDSEGYSKLIKDGLNRSRHRTLNRTASDNTFITSPFSTGNINNSWLSTDSVNYSKDKDCNNKCELRNCATLRNGNSRCNRNERIVRASSLKIYTDSDSKRNSLSSPTTSGDRTSRTIHEEPKRSSGYREVLLEFPNSGLSSHSSAARRSEKNKDVRSEFTSRRLQPARSLSGLTDCSIKDGRSNSADVDNVERKSRSFFLFFRKKKKTDDSRSPSPTSKSSIQQQSPQQPCSPSTATRLPSRSDSIPVQSDKDRRQSAQSLASSRFPTTFSSSTSPQTPSSPPSVNSPTMSSLSTSPVNKDRFPQYISRSMSKHRKETAHHKSTRPSITDSDDQLRHEDLPPHPSIKKRSIEKTNSFPYSQYLKYNSQISTSNINKINNRSPVSTRRRNSMPETSLAVEETAVVRSPSGMNLKALKGESENLRSKSVNISRKTIVDPQTTTSGGEEQKQSLSGSDNIRYLPNTDIRVITDAEDFEFNPTEMNGPINLSFCGCGFLGMYHLGVVSSLALRGSSFLDRVEKVGGTSAGALMAAILVTARDKIEETAEQIQNLAREIRKKTLGPLTPGYNFSRSLRCMLEDILPEDAHEAAQGKLFVSLTNAETKCNELLSDFKTRDELIETLVASCYMPVYAGIKTPTIRGKKYTDGGLSDSLPKFETGRTITVSPFDGKSDIGPKVGEEFEKKAHFVNVYNQDIQVTINNMKRGSVAFFPPKPQTLQEYFEKGRYDTSRFLIREGLYETTTPPPQTKTVLYESSV